MRKGQSLHWISRHSDEVSLSRWIRLACYAEVAAPKAGNVHFDASFDDLTAADFLRAAEVTAPIIATSRSGLGQAIENAVQAAIDETQTNVNLGICLLLAPLAAVVDSDWPSVRKVLDTTTIDDASNVYRAIRTATPGGLGRVDEGDVINEPTITLQESMTLAAQHDGIASLYSEYFVPLFEFALPTFLEGVHEVGVETAIVRLAIHWHARYGDTHIARRSGEAIAKEASRRANEVVDNWSRLDGFDDWLRADGHRRNPGTTADVVAATLFAAIRTSEEIDQLLTTWLKDRGIE